MVNANMEQPRIPCRIRLATVRTEALEDDAWERPRGGPGFLGNGQLVPS